MDQEAEIKRVTDLMGRLDPLMQRYLTKVIERDGANVGLSIGSNLATSLMAFSLVMVARQGGNVDQFMHVMLNEIRHKYGHVQEKVLEATGMFDLLMATNGHDTCRPLH